MSTSTTSKKSNYSFLRIILGAVFLVFVSYQIFADNNNEEDFEKGRQLYEVAKKSFEEGNFDVAITQLEESLSLGFDAANGLLGEVHLKQHNYKAALHYLKEGLNAKNVEPFVPDYYGWVNYNLGMSYYLERNGNIAYKYFKASHDLGYPPAAEYVNMLKEKEDRLPKG